MWGWTVIVIPSVGNREVNPTYVGMDRGRNQYHQEPSCKPHVCGDGPARVEWTLPAKQ